MPLRTVCCFTHLTSEHGWDDPQYSVKKFVDALKGRPVNKWADIPVGSGPRRRLEQANSDDAVAWFGEMAADLLRHEKLVGELVLVPFPSSKCDVATSVSKTCRLADSVASAFNATVSDILRYDAAQPSASTEGGPRAPELIYPHLVTTGPVLGGRPHVLIDDVLTSGGHLRAAAALLRRLRVEVVLAVCGVFASHEPSATPFERVFCELPDFEPDDSL